MEDLLTCCAVLLMAMGNGGNDCAFKPTASQHTSAGPVLTILRGCVYDIAVKPGGCLQAHSIEADMSKTIYPHSRSDTPQALQAQRM